MISMLRSRSASSPCPALGHGVISLERYSMTTSDPVYHLEDLVEAIVDDETRCRRRDYAVVRLLDETDDGVAEDRCWMD